MKEQLSAEPEDNIYEKKNYKIPIELCVTIFLHSISFHYQCTRNTKTTVQLRNLEGNLEEVGTTEKLSASELVAG